MIKREKDGVVWLEFEIFQAYPEFVHGVFLKHGGYSHGEYGSLNFGWHQGDSPLLVAENIVKALKLLNVSKVAWSDLEHGNQVLKASEDGYTGIGDGLVTDCTDLGLMVTHADCQAVLMYDPVKKVAVNLHVGWKGNVANIFKHAVASLQTNYGTNPENIRVGISPSLGPENAQFINYRTELPENFWQHQVKPEYFDLWEISKQQLIETGLLPHHIQIAGISTYANPDDYFSYRRCKASGRHATIVALEPIAKLKHPVF